MSVISSDGPVRINSVVLDRPVVQIKVLKDGLANYDIALDTPPDSVATDPAEAANALRLWPNPAREAFTVGTSLPLTEPVLLEVFDGRGRRCYRQALPGLTSYVVDATPWPSGLYTVVITVAGRQITGRMVKS